MQNAKVLFKFGSYEEYHSLETKLDNALYFLIDTNELYRGTIPIGQTHVYSGIREPGVSDAEAIAALLNEVIPVIGDIVILNNGDETSDAFIYKSNDNWLLLGTTITSSITETVHDLTNRVSDIEAQLSQISGALHFKGAVASIEELHNITEKEVGDVYQVGSNSYAWNGNEWINLGSIYDLSVYATKEELNAAIEGVEALIGAPESSHEEIDPETGEIIIVKDPATGIYAELAYNADKIIASFDGAKAGLVPVDDAAGADAEHRFLNAQGKWVTLTQGEYIDPEGNVYTNVEDYVEYMISKHAQLSWEDFPWDA